MATKKQAEKVRLYAMASTPAIHVGDDKYSVNPDRSIDVPSSMVKDFLKMGCTRELPKD